MVEEQQPSFNIWNTKIYAVAILDFNTVNKVVHSYSSLDEELTPLPRALL